MPFLAAIPAAIAAGAGSAAVGAGVNAISQAAQGQGGAGYKAPSLGITQSGGAYNSGSVNQAAVQNAQNALNDLEQKQQSGQIGGEMYQVEKSNLQQQLSQAQQPQGAGPQLVMPTTGGQAQTAYNQTQQGLQNQQDLNSQLAAQNGIQNQSSVYGQQQALANQLGQLAQGNGPSIAQNQLNQTTGANVANQAALMAGQRGAGSNAGLIARQAAQQGAATQQQAVGQAATLRAQEQLNAIGALQNQQGMLGNTATQQVGQQMQGANAYNNAAQGQQGQLLNALQGQNSILSGNQNAQNNINANMAQQNAQNANQLSSGLASGIGSAIQAGLTPAKKMAMGGIAADSSNQSAALKENYNGRSKIGRHLSYYAKGGKVAAMLSPGEIYLKPQEAKMVAEGKESPMKIGERIPGQAKVKGDSLKNDIVPKNLDIGGVVIKRSKAFDEDKAKQFVKIIESKNKKRNR